MRPAEPASPEVRPAVGDLVVTCGHARERQGITDGMVSGTALRPPLSHGPATIAAAAS